MQRQIKITSEGRCLRSRGGRAEVITMMSFWLRKVRRRTSSRRSSSDQSVGLILDLSVTPEYNQSWWALDIAGCTQRFRNTETTSVPHIVWPPAFFRSKTLLYSWSAVALSSAVRVFWKDFFGTAARTSSNGGRLERRPGTGISRR
jgi:hypothetical protein